MTGRRIDPRLVVVASFASLGLGFLAGYQLRGGRSESAGVSRAPHQVGVEEYLQLGLQSLEAGDYAEAERRFRQAVDLNPQDPNSRLDLAMSLMSQGDWAAADRELGEAKRLAPSMPAVWFLEGWLARNGFGDTLRMRTAWGRFLELAPPDAPQTAEIRRLLESGTSGPEVGSPLESIGAERETEADGG